ncbi:MAG: Trk system potassium transporter TrkA [Ruminococcaceae bacterium]|nr:Trk system potassium transporter TrkA [Oscillospiraceae bacterium]
MNIIIVGCGKVGSTIAEQLQIENHDVTVVDIDEEVVNELTYKLDIMGVVGNGTSNTVLQEAGISDADIVIAVTEMDEMNLLCCLIAKKTSNCNTVARVRNPIYSNETEFLKKELGISMIINPELAASQEVSRLLSLPSVIEISTFANGKIEILKLKVEKNSVLCGMTLIKMRKAIPGNVLICAVEREDEALIPTGDFIIEAEDYIYIIASKKDSQLFLSSLGLFTDKVKDTIIIGGGGLAYYLATDLLYLGLDVKIIEIDRERCEELSELLPKASIIHGDGIDESLLLEEGLTTASSLVALTNLDEENIMLSLYAKKISGEKIKTVTKINKITFDEVISSLNLGSVVVPKNIMTEHILQYVRALENSYGSNVETMYRLVNGKVEALEFNVNEDSEVVDIPLKSLNIKKNILISCINRKGKIITPGGDDAIHRGDTVIVVTTESGLSDLSEILD